MNNLEAAKAHQAEFLKELRAIKEPYTVNVNGLDIVVHPGVFPPVTDSQLLASHIRVSSGDRVLDLTTGSGVFAVIAGLQGATGLAVDLNPAAVVNAKENFKHFVVTMEAIESDLFDNVPQERFDYIFANGPYTEGEATEPLQLSFYGAKRFLTKLFSETPSYLKPQGRILITFAEWGELDFFETTAYKNGFTLEVLDRKWSDNRRVYRLYEARVKL